jgi:hypothetical protein
MVLEQRVSQRKDRNTIRNFIRNKNEWAGRVVEREIVNIFVL